MPIETRGAGGGGADSDAIHDNVDGEINAVSDKASPVGADIILIEDSASSYAKKKVSITNLPGGSDADAIHDNVANEITGITNKATPVAADELLIEDSANSYNKKAVLFSALEGALTHNSLSGVVANEHLDWTGSVGTIHTGNYIEGGDGTDTTAIHDDTTGEINALSDKASPVGADILIIEDSAASFGKKKVSITNLPGGADADAIHDNVAAEISVITEKVSPVGADLVLIEDSADSNNKKRVQITNLPGGADADAIHDNVANEITAITPKTVPVSADEFVIEDSGASYIKKALTYGNLESNLTHNNLSGIDAGDINHLTDAQVGALHSIYTLEAHTLATSGVHSDTLPLTDLAVGTQGSMIRRGAADWEELGLGTNTYVLKSGATDIAWGQVDYSELVGTQPAPVAHDLATTGPHQNTLPLTDLAVGSQGSIIKVGASDWEELGKGTNTYVLKAGVTDISWSTVDWSELTGSQPSPISHALDSHNVPTGSIAMSTQKFTGLAAGSGAGESVRYEQLHAQSHGSSDHSGAVLPAGANEDLGAYYLDIDDIAVPADPAASIRRLFVNTATGKLSVRTNSSTTISLEEQGGTDADAIHDNVASEITGITNKASLVSADELLIEDSADTYNKKAVLFSVLEGAISHVNITGVVANEHLDWTGSVGTIHTGNYIEGGDGTDGTAIHDNVANEITTITAKTTPVSADEFVMEDSANSFNKKAITYGNLESAIQNHAPASHALDSHGVPTGSIAMSTQKFTGLAAGTTAGDSVRFEQLHAESHDHDTDTLQLDGINSNGGAFSFTTSGQVTFSQSIDVPVGGLYVNDVQITSTPAEINTLDGYTGDLADFNRIIENGRAQGDVLYASATNTLGWLAKGTDNYHFVMNGNVPNWEALDISLDTSPTLGGNLTSNENAIWVENNISTNQKYEGFITNLTVTGLTFGQCVYVNGNNTGALADADAVGTMPCVGIYVATNTLVTYGSIKNTSWSWTANNQLYVGTDGNLTATAPSGTGDQIQKVAVATSATTIFVSISIDIIEHV